MKKYPLGILCITLFFLWQFVVGDVALAGVTGTLAGTVTDQKTGESLPGANIVIKGSKMGTMADQNGFFLINNIPAGRYSITASMMGYTSVTKEGVTVLVDLRTTIEFILSPTVLDLGEEVTVTAEAPMIQRDVTATTHFISQEEMEQLPVQSFQQVVDIQPGVAAGHIRGGRKTEVLYLVDGLPVQEAIEGEVGSELPYSSVIDMTVQTGGFNAEYGDAMSGVVNIITKDGSSAPEGRLEIYTLNYGNDDNPFDLDDSNHDLNYELNCGGPLWMWGDRVKWFLSANLRDPHSRWKREEFGTRMRVFNSTESRSYNIINKITSYLRDSDRLTFQGLLSIWDWWEYDNKWLKNLEGLPFRSKKSYRLSLDWTHTFNPRTFFSVKFSIYNVLKSIYGTDPGETRDQIEWENSDPDSFIVSGSYPWQLDHEEIQHILKFDWVSQMTNNHQMKAGAEFVYYDLYKWNKQWTYQPTPDPDFPLYIQYVTDYHYYPKKGALYVQDKIEYEGMIANVGLRFDYLDPQASRPALEKIPGQQGQWEWVVHNDEMIPAEVKYQISPRFGVNLPIAEGQELHVNYGYFFQTPLFDYLYTNVNYNPQEGFSPLAGNPDLKPAKTIMYEASYKHQLATDMVMDITLFSKDVSNLVDTKTYRPESEKEDESGYVQYVNMAWVDIHGLEVFLKKRYGRFLSGKVSYTYMTAKGTGSSEREGYDWTRQGYEVPIGEYYLSWDQRHTLVLDLDIRKPKNWGLNLLWRWNSPLPYTKNVGPHTTPNNKRMSVTTELDIRLNKDFTFNGWKVFLFGEVLNVFDRSNILWLDEYGRPGGRLDDPGALDLRRRFRFGMGLDF
ncbi:MAG: TonB-dependent receptor [Gemmatimonadota bacterium]|nr:MAG: TonB-dependent receptor [Gemmatimonadota bacterium]